MNLRRKAADGADCDVVAPTQPPACLEARGSSPSRDPRKAQGVSAADPTTMSVIIHFSLIRATS